MANLFNYSTLNVSLEKETRTLKILLDRPECEHAINAEMLFELESILAWSAGRIEINSILISSTESTGNLLSSGLDKNYSKQMTGEKILRLQEKLQKISLSILSLPQTVVVDYKNGAQDIALEMTSGADVKIAAENAEFMLTHLEKGLSPFAGFQSILANFLSQSLIRNWLFSGMNLKCARLVDAGFILSSYQTQEEKIHLTNCTLFNINAQAPVARMQTKHAMNQGIWEKIEKNMETEKNTHRAVIITEDFKAAQMAEQNETTAQFIPAQKYREFVHQFKNQEQQDNHSVQ